MHCSFSSHPFPSSLIVLWRTPLFPCLALVTIWKSYPDPEYLFVYADALLQCAWATTYRSYTAYKDIMFPGILHLKVPIKKWVHMVSKGPWSLKKKKKRQQKKEYKSERAAPTPTIPLAYLLFVLGAKARQEQYLWIVLPTTTPSVCCH